MTFRQRPAPITILLLAVLAWNCSTPPRDDSKTSGGPFNENIRPTDPRTPEEEQKGFILPPGFEIELFASEPDIDKPMNLAFDAKGRLWVTQSFEYPFPTFGGKPTDKLTIIEDTDGDGKADKFTQVSDTLNIPIGILPLADGAISFSVPNVYRLTDSNGDAVLESSKVMFGPFGYQDTHGMVSNLMRGYDGWVHACHGFTNRSSFAGADGDSITLVSGNTFRFRPDGSRVEQLTFGQVNPFGLVFDVFGYVYSTDSHSSPLYQLIRGGDYPHFGKVSVMGFAPDMKSLEKEATALCGITQYADTKFPEEFHGNFFIGDVVNSRVHRYTATWKGSSPFGRSEVDFIKSEDPWFRPVNIKLGPDGALYVADFYNAIIGHYEVPLDHPKRDKQRGRIWRITYKGQSNKPIDLTALNIEELIHQLNSDNLPVRMAATDQITDRIGREASTALDAVLSNASASGRQTIHALWAQHRLGSLDNETILASLQHTDSLVRIHALRILAEREPVAGNLEAITKALNDTSPHVRRAAVELLTKYPSITSVDLALGVLKATDPTFDNHLFYTSKLAIRNILRNEGVLNESIAGTWSEADASILASIMVDVPYPAAARFLTDYMSRGTLATERMPAAYTQIARFTPVNELGVVVNKALSDHSSNINLQASIYKGLLDGLNQRGGNIKLKVFDEHAPAIAEGLLKKYPPTDTTDTEEKYIHQRTAIDIAGDYRVKSLEPVLKQFLSEGHRLGWTMRGAALRSLMKIDQANAGIGAEIVEKDSVREYQRRIAAVLGEFPGKAINDALGSLNYIPADVQESVVIALAGSSQGKDVVIKKVKDGTILPRVLISPRADERLASNASPSQKKEFQSLTADLDPVSEEKQKVIQARLTAFESLDRKTLKLDSGRMTFEQNCALCHKTGGELSVGPQLHGIGNTGARGLIEKIIDPNRNISRAFKNYTVTMKDGTIKSGLYRRDEGATKVYADITGKEFSIAKSDIAEEKLSKYTLMPDTFAETIPEREFNQLLNYLLTL
jgi:putative heme-binding domain-containing protein